MRRLVWAVCGLLVCGLMITPGLRAEDAVDYVRDIQPIFQKHCVSCHGAEKQESGLRLDSVKFWQKGGDRGAALVAGKSAESVLYQSLIGEGDVTEMPAEGSKLTADQVALIRRWIDAGARAPLDAVVKSNNAAKDHWAFQPIARPAIPIPKESGWARNPIDQFVLARLEREHLTPSKAADRPTLIRRLSFDLRGLPPTWNEVEEFVADVKPGAYERLVDRLLASPQYGERWGRHWLDAARYADSHGFTIDGPRSIWKYRDWVIGAFNRDLPFDQFTIEQLAGDLLPNPKREQLIATGFHRNTLVNQEGGTDQEQFRIEAVVDRINTTGTVWMGLTVGCAQCHQHKYDPVSQREYYELFAFFNNQDEPTLQVPTPDQTQRLKKLDQAIAAAEQPLKAHDAEFAKGLTAWEEQLASQLNDPPAWTVLKPTSVGAEKDSVLAVQENQAIYVDGSGPDTDTFLVTAELPLESVTAIRLEALTHESLPNGGPGRAANGNFVLHEVEVLQGPTESALTPLKLGHAVADYSQDNFPILDAIDGNTQKTGWGIYAKQGSLNVNREAIFFPQEAISAAKGLQLQFRLHHNYGSKYTLGHFRLSVSDAPMEALSIPDPIRRVLAKSKDKRSPAEQDQLVAAHQATDTQRKPLAEKVSTLNRQRDELAEAVPTTMILRERAKPRETHIHVRGDFLRHGAKVTPAVPTVLPPLDSASKTPNRLDFANWLVDADHPLTARVTVNRVWQRYFGLGLVETENDFGLQSSPPTHPELLDWLAAEFMGQSEESAAAGGNPHAWSLKALHRLIVTSATYRQSSAVREELLDRDPNNRLLARQTRMRLEAEIVRDVSLAACGLLSSEMHGPGVHPPQPAGIYVMTQQKKPWPEEQGADRFRRGLYTYFWRSSPYPMLVTFDASEANVSCTRRPRSNTPLQALTLANDQAFVEMAQALAVRTLTEAPGYLEGQLRHLFHLAFSREPTESELAVLLPFVERQQEYFQKDQTAAQAAAPKTMPKDVSISEAATWVAVARVLLNLDEFITRE